MGHGQNPSFTKMGILVVTIAVAMMMSNGRDDKRVSKPNNSKMPHTISKEATK